MKWRDENWKDFYKVNDYGKPIYDAAVLWKKDSYIPGSFMCLSFQFQKHLSLGRGGIILCDNKEDAIKLLAEEYGWTPYPQKHFESRFTKFFEGYWFPERYGFDTRRVQFSSLIVTDQMTREDAIEKLKHPAIDASTVKQDKEYIASKLRISVEELDSFMDLPKKTYKDYKNQEWMFKIGSKVLQLIGAEKNAKRE